MQLSRLLASFAIFAAIPVSVLAKEPDCTGSDAWPSGMAFTHLKNAGLFGDQSVDSSKTSVRLIASEKIGKDLFRQVHLVKFLMKTGGQLSAITVNAGRLHEGKWQKWCRAPQNDGFIAAERLDPSQPCGFLKNHVRND